METIGFTTWGQNLENFQGLNKPLILIICSCEKEYNDNFEALFLAMFLCLFLYPRVHDLCPIWQAYQDSTKEKRRGQIAQGFCL